MKEPVSRDLLPTLFLGLLKEQIGSPYRTHKIVCMIENPREVHKIKDQEDEGDMDVGPVHDKEKIVREEEQDYDIPLHDGVIQPLTPQTVHIIPPDDDYVAPATNLILDKQLNEFGEEFSDITRVAEKENDKDPSDVNTYDYETFIQKLLHQVSQSSHEAGMTKREMKSHQRYGSNLSSPYPVTNLHHHGVHCYSHSYLISSEGRNTLLLGK
ncbi:hypothetical protein Tco_1217279 [Tanacetum coccineum]